MSESELKELLTPYTLRIGGLIQALRAIMLRNGWINPDDYSLIAEVFNKSVAEVRGVVSFYTDFKTTLPKSSLIKVCQAESCQALGARKLSQELEASTLASREDLEIEHVYCLGLCPIGPAVEVNGQLLAEATYGKIESLAP
ncbi:MAG: NAD(P)H-dependent oxidoreductase subunit E [Gammaproteobacteria bacterium]|nr:NAD(P)H-dependent oxidoreductase subunit E [Gammaproteobacteria bacterium]